MTKRQPSGPSAHVENMNRRCPVCNTPLRLRKFCRTTTYPCENPHCQLAFGTYRTVEEVAAALKREGTEQH